MLHDESTNGLECRGLSPEDRLEMAAKIIAVGLMRLAAESESADRGSVDLGKLDAS